MFADSGIPAFSSLKRHLEGRRPNSRKRFPRIIAQKKQVVVSAFMESDGDARSRPNTMAVNKYALSAGKNHARANFRVRADKRAVNHRRRRMVIIART